MLRLYSRGFTLIEVLVALSILTILGIGMMEIVSRSLVSNVVTHSVNTIKQNGQQAMDLMDRVIRGSDYALCTSNTPTKTLVVEKDGVYTRFRFVDPTSFTNGQIQRDSPLRVPAEGDIAFVARVCSLSDPMSNAQVFTDTNIQTGVSIENGGFIIQKVPGLKDVVKISFNLNVGVGVQPSLSNKIQPIPVAATIQLR